MPAARGLLRDLAERSERGGVPHEPPVGQRFAGGARARARRAALTTGTRRDRRAGRASRPRARRRAPPPARRRRQRRPRCASIVLDDGHAARIGPWRPPPVRAARASCSRRSARRTTATRACSPSARTRAGGVPRLADPGRRAPRARRRHRNGRRRDRARARRPGSHGGRRRPEPGDARGRARAGRARPARATASSCARARAEAAAVRRRRVRRRSPSPTCFATSTMPPATLRELARVVRPGGTVAMLEFGLPRGVWRPLVGALRASRAAGCRRASSRRAGATSAASSARASATSGGSWPRAAPPRGSGARRASPTCEARRLSLGGGIVVWGKRA